MFDLRIFAIGVGHSYIKHGKVFFWPFQGSPSTTHLTHGFRHGLRSVAASRLISHLVLRRVDFFALLVDVTFHGSCIGRRFAQVTFGIPDNRSRHRHVRRSPSCVDVWKLLFQVRHLRRVVEHDVGLVRMQSGVVLMIGLCRIETLQWHDLGHDAV